MRKVTHYRSKSINGAPRVNWYSYCTMTWSAYFFLLYIEVNKMAAWRRRSRGELRPTSGRPQSLVMHKHHPGQKEKRNVSNWLIQLEISVFVCNGCVWLTFLISCRICDIQSAYLWFRSSLNHSTLHEWRRPPCTIQRSALRVGAVTVSERSRLWLSMDWKEVSLYSGQLTGAYLGRNWRGFQRPKATWQSEGLTC